MDRTVENSAKATSVEGVAAAQSLSQQVTGKPSWTIAVDLSTNLRNSDGSYTGAGATDKWQKLQQLAKDTVDKPVTFVVSVTKPEDAQPAMIPNSVGRVINPLEQPQENDSKSVGTAADKSAAPPESAANGDAQEQIKTSNSSFSRLFGPQKMPTVETYVIKNGTVTKEESGPSLGTAKDIEHLLETARSKAPSSRLGLIIFAHGTGTDIEGIDSDAGNATLSQVSGEIATGLGEGKKLDLLVFDGCKMASTETAHFMQDVATTLVASEDQEIASLKDGFDGMNINAPMRRLLEKPGMSGQDLARSFIDESNKGANGKPAKSPYEEYHLRSGADTVTAIDLTRYSQFEKSLNNFASAMRGSLGSAQNREAIARAVDASPSLPSRSPAYTNFQRDTREFAKLILDQVNHGKLRDDGSIKKSAEAMLKDQAAMTLGYFGSSKFYKGLGGLTVELQPAGEEAQRAYIGSKTIPGALYTLSHDARDFATKPATQARTMSYMNMLHSYESAGGKRQLKALNTAAQSILDSRSPQQYDRAILELRKTSAAYLNSPAGRKVTGDILSSIHTTASTVSGAEWANFVNELTDSNMRAR